MTHLPTGQPMTDERAEEIRAHWADRLGFTAQDIGELLDERARLLAGQDSIPPEPGSWMTPGQWIKHWNGLDAAGRLELAGLLLENAQHVTQCLGLREMERRVRAAIAERRTEIAEDEAERGPSPWSDAAAVTCYRIEEAMRTPAEPQAALDRPQDPEDT